MTSCFKPSSPNLGFLTGRRLRALAWVSDADVSVLTASKFIHNHFSVSLIILSMEHENHVQSSFSEIHTEPTSALDNVDIDAAYAELQCIPDDDPDKLDLLDDIGYLFLCRYDYLTDVVDLSKSVLAREQAVRLTPDRKSVV